jgi:hypothetical protein
MNAHRLIPSIVVATALGALVFASAPAQAEGCPNEQLRSEQPYGLTLPDCRAYEMVSPLEKGDGDATIPGEEAAQASLSGDAATYENRGVFAEPQGGSFLDQYMARREAGGWVDRSLTPPYKAYRSNTSGPFASLIFSPELTEGIAFTDVPLTEEAKQGYYNLYVASFGAASTSYRLVTTAPPGRPFEFTDEGTQPVGASTDFSHVAYAEEVARPAPHRSVFEAANGNVATASVTNGGELFPNAWAGGPTVAGGAPLGLDTWRSLSADGSKLFFTSPPFFEEDNQQLYVRENADAAQSPLEGERCTVPSDACTVELSASERADPDPNGSGSAHYVGASADGSRVFFTDCAKLTDDATASHDPGEKTNCEGADDDLYEYAFANPEGERLRDLTVDGAEPAGARVLGVVNIDEDGANVYFVAEGVLTSEESSRGARPVAGQPNLYLYHESQPGTASPGPPKFIATLAPATVAGEHEEGGDSSDWAEESPVLNTVRATPDGTHLAFLSTESLTGYDNEPVEPADCTQSTRAGAGAVPCREVFSYDADTNALVCVSCNPSGALPSGPSSFGERPSDDIAEEAFLNHTPRNFSSDGSRLFFDSYDALVPRDNNGRQDVYEWESAGEGSCGQPGGCVYPISDVEGGANSFFLDADPSGENVFFATEDQLVPADVDGHVDVYDARIGGGFTVSTPASTCDNPDSCKPPVSPQPELFGAPASATFSGPGNAAPASAQGLGSTPSAPKKITKKAVKCKRGFVKKKGKCVKFRKKGKAKKSSHHKGGR